MESKSLLSIEKTIIKSDEIPYYNCKKHLIGYKDNKKLYLHPYFVQKLVYIEESLIKLDVCILLIKGGLFLTNIMKFWKKLAILSKTNSIETLHVIKNI